MGVGSLVGIINLLIAPVGNVLMKFGCRARELRILVDSEFFQPGKLSSCHHESLTCAW